MAYESYVLVCGGTACCSSGGTSVVEAFKKELEAAGLKDKVQVVVTGCLGFCEQGPIVKILPQGTFYVQVKTEDVKEIVAEHLVKGRVVQRLCYDPEQAKKLVAEANIPFYQKQYRIVLRNCGIIDPEKIEDYIARVQRRRGRPRRVHGPLHAGRRSPLHPRGHDDRRLRDRRLQGLHLHPRGIPARHRAPPDRHPSGA